MNDELKKEVEEEEIEEQDINLDGFQVVRKEFFSHSYDYSISIRPDHIRFSASIVKRLADAYYVQLLINPAEKRMVVRPCDVDDKDSIHWAYDRARDSKKAARDVNCKLFCMKLYDLLKWNTNYRYKIQGALVKSNNELIMVFNFDDQEAFELGQRSGSSTLPEEWMNSFGLPLPEHERNLKVSVLSGYARMELIQKRNRRVQISRDQIPQSTLVTESDKVE